MVRKEGVASAFGSVVGGAIKAYDKANKYLSGDRDSMYDFNVNAYDSDISKTELGKFLNGDKLRNHLGSYKATKDFKKNKVKIEFDTTQVSDTFSKACKPGDNDTLAKYITGYKDGTATMILDMNESIDLGTGNESMMTPVQVKKRYSKCDSEGRPIKESRRRRRYEDVLNEFDEDEDYYEELKRKSVQDSDGFWTDYTMYHNLSNDKYVMIFGDSDVYNPTNSEPDAEFDTYDEADEWFDSYDGFSNPDWDPDEEVYADLDSDKEYDSYEDGYDWWDDHVDLRSESLDEEHWLFDPFDDPDESSEDDSDYDFSSQESSLDLKTEDYWFGGSGKTSSDSSKTEQPFNYTDTPDIRFNLDTNDEEEKDEEVESLRLKETPGLTLSAPRVDNKGVLEIEINGKKYRYTCNNPDSSSEEIADKVTKMKRYSDGKALAYLKKNMRLVNESYDRDIDREIKDVFREVSYMYDDLNSDDAVEEIEVMLKDKGIFLDPDDLGNRIAQYNKISIKRESLDLDVGDKSVNEYHIIEDAIKEVYMMYGDFESDAIEEIKRMLKEKDIELSNDDLEEKISEFRRNNIVESNSFKQHHVCKTCGKTLDKCTCKVSSNSEDKKECIKEGFKDQDGSLFVGKEFISRLGNKIKITSIDPIMSMYNGEPYIKLGYDYELTNGKKGSSTCDTIDLFRMIHDRRHGEEESIIKEGLLSVGQEITTRLGNKIKITSLDAYMSDYDGSPEVEVGYDYELTNGKKGSSRCFTNSLFNMINDSRIKEEVESFSGSGATQVSNVGQYKRSSIDMTTEDDKENKEDV